MNLYAIDIKLFGTAYAKAENPQDAVQKIKQFLWTEVTELSGPCVDARAFDDPTLSEVSLGPSFTPIADDVVEERLELISEGVV